MFRTIADRIPQDRDLPDRAYQMQIMQRVLDGSFYDALPHLFHEETTGPNNSEYIPVRDRSPSIRTNLCRLIVEDSASLLFGEGRFPTLFTDDTATRDKLMAIVKETKLNQVMLAAAIKGSVGSVVLRLRVLKGRLFFDALPTTFLTPAYDPEAPDTLISVTEKYKVKGASLKANGYFVAPDKLDSWFWFQRIWDTSGETWFVPWEVSSDTADKPHVPAADESRSLTHELGFVPLVWIQNLPGGDEPDGWCTFKSAIDTVIEIDYQLSQAGRGLKYSSDPTLMIKEPAAPDDTILRSADQALVVSEKGDAKLLEINGTAAQAVIDYVKFLRETALESAHGNRSSPDRLHAAQSGRAMELMHQSLIWLADNLRASYGEDGLVALITMVIKSSQKMALTVGGLPLGKLIGPVALRWSPWFPPTEGDKGQQANALTTLTKNGLMSRETAVSKLGDTYDLEDNAAEMARIAADEAEQDARTLALAAQVKATETVES